MTSQAEKRRRKKARVTLSDGSQVEQRAPTDPKREKPEDPMRVVARARMRRSGLSKAEDAVQPICGTEMGLCIMALSQGDDRAALVNVWEAISASHRNYRAFYVGKTGSPQGAAIAMLPDRMETNQSLRVDMRTPEEKAEAAKASWRAWETRIAALPAPTLKWAVRGALDGFIGEERLWRDAGPTVTGKVAVSALRLLSEGVS